MIDPSKEFKIQCFRTKETASKKIMGSLQLEDCFSGEILNCVIWEESINSHNKIIFKTGNIVSIADGIYNSQYKNYNIKKLELIKEAKSGHEKAEREKLFEKILEEINNIENKSLKEAVLKIIFENEELFKISPAAKNNHHNYVGGLMQHIYECIQFAKINIELFKHSIDKDVIIAACVVHDIGKLFEYKIDQETGLVEIDEEFQKIWISHIHYGFSWANQNGFSTLARIIAAHHGRKDWGALIDLDEKNVEPILYLMHHIDDLSAKFGAINVEDLDDLKDECLTSI